jgi:hypothetical protein
MNLRDYLIDQAGKDWAQLLADWAPPLPSDFTLWLVNRFGDAFIVTADGAVSMLDVGAGSFERLADSRDRFGELLDVDNNASVWLMIPLVDECVATGMTLGAQQCYGFKIPPVLGGTYELDNVELKTLTEYYSFTAYIHRQTRDLPEGAQVKLDVAG